MRLNYFPIALKPLIAIATLLFFSAQAHAANWYVEPSAKGSGNGTSWNNAWSMSSISWGGIKPGDTVWLAGGTYNTDLIVANTCNGTSGSPVTIMRVTSADSAPVAAAGWNSAFDSQVVINCPDGGPGIDVGGSSYITVDGHENSGSLYNNTRVYGIKVVVNSSGGDGVRIGEGYPPATCASASVTNVTMRNIDILGNYDTSLNTTTYGFNCAPYNNTRTNLLFHDCRVMGIGEAFRENEFNGCVIEYCWISNLATDGDHEDIDLTYPGSNETWRYNYISTTKPDGIIFDPAGYVNWSFYGNVVYNTTSAIFDFNGTTPNSYGPLYIYNNTFVAPATNPDYPGSSSAWFTLNPGCAPAGSQFYNNILWYVDGSQTMQTGGCAVNYNAYNYPPMYLATNWSTSIATGDTHAVALQFNPFVNSAAGDFHLTAAGAAALANGVALTANGFYNYDADGKQRGANGNWYIGAYQYGSGAQAPLAPADLRVSQ